jgi:hypothetical protein
MMLKSMSSHSTAMRLLTTLLLAAFVLTTISLVWPAIAKAWSYQYQCNFWFCSNCTWAEHCYQYLCPDGCSIQTCCWLVDSWDAIRANPLCCF